MDKLTIEGLPLKSILSQSIRKSLQHKEVLVRDGTECIALPLKQAKPDGS